MKRRLYFDLFKPLAFETEIRRALVLMGPRRVGKTVMLFHLVEELVEKGVDPQKIKWSNRFFEKPRELKSLIQFCKENKLNRALVSTIDKSGVQHVDDIEIHYHPAAAYAYTVGKRTLEMKTKK